jgi:hypothetical protein
MKALILLLLCCLTSCSVVPTPMKDAKGNARVAVLWGGKGSLEYNADGSMSLVYANEKSFQHAAQVVTAAAAGYMSHLNTVASESTKAVTQREITNRFATKSAADTAAAQSADAAAQNGKAIDAGLFAPAATTYQQK